MRINVNEISPHINYTTYQKGKYQVFQEHLKNTSQYFKDVDILGTLGLC
jgi:hypothetical protein